MRAQHGPQQDPYCCEDVLSACAVGWGGPEDSCRPETRPWRSRALSPVALPPSHLMRAAGLGTVPCLLCRAKQLFRRCSHGTLNFPVHFSRTV